MTMLLPPILVPVRRTLILFLAFCMVAGTMIPAACTALGEGAVYPPNQESAGYLIAAGEYFLPFLPIYIAPLQVATIAPVNVSTTAVQYTFKTTVPTKTPATAATTSPIYPPSTQKTTVNPVITPVKGIVFATMTTPPLALPRTTLPLNVSTRTMQPACPSGMTACGSDCISLNTDIDHCGFCENACARCSATGQTTIECIDGHCLRDCGNGYTDIESDPNNCGCCGNRVTPPMICHDGSYALNCNGKIFYAGDINNCGACGVQCHPELHERCYNSRCACVEGYSLCNGVCIPTNNDTINCGGCGIRCRADQICYQGNCECLPSYGIPGGGHGFECSGVCKNLASDILNCGTCGHVCGWNAALNESRCNYGECMSICENSQWTNTDTDRNNCGGCGNHCAEWADCIEGECIRKTCLSGETLCASMCKDLQADNFNCGACGRVCSGGECINSQCYYYGACPSGWADCDGDGHCENLSAGSNGYYCGSCDSMCRNDLVCFAGACRVSCPQGHSRCGRTCYNLMNNPNHCGECDNRCTNTQVCESGQCVTPCPEGSRRCNGTCMLWAEFYFDNNNCGSCGNRCNVVCAMGVCLFG